MVEIGQWEKAIVLAPAVSLVYWKQLCEQYAQYLSSTESEECIPLYVGTGSIDKLLSFYVSRKQLNDAAIISQTKHEGGFFMRCEETVPKIIDKSLASSLTHSTQLPPAITSQISESLSKTSEDMINIVEIAVNKYIQDAYPVLAATMYLTIDEYEKAIRTLIRGNEILLAYAVTQALRTLHYKVCLLSHKLLILCSNTKNLIAFWRHCVLNMVTLNRQLNCLNRYTIELLLGV